MSPGPIDVTCALLLREGRLLVARRADNGRWELPGGKREPGESLAQCLAREIAEELGAKVAVLRPWARADDADRGIRLHCFLCRLERGEPRPLEHLELRWVTPGEMAGLGLCPADRKLAHLLAGADLAHLESTA